MVFMLTVTFQCLFHAKEEKKSILVSNVLFTRVKNDSKSSRVMASSKSSWCSFLLTVWKIFNWVEIWTICWYGKLSFPNLEPSSSWFTLFCNGSPSCKINFHFGLANFSNMLVKFKWLQQDLSPQPLDL